MDYEISLPKVETMLRRVLFLPGRGQDTHSNAREEASRVHVSLCTSSCCEVGAQYHPEGAAKNGMLARKDLTQDSSRKRPGPASKL